MAKIIRIAPIKPEPLTEDYFCRFTQTAAQEQRRQNRRRADAVREAENALFSLLCCVSVSAVSVLVCILTAL